MKPSHYICFWHLLYIQICALKKDSDYYIVAVFVILMSCDAK